MCFIYHINQFSFYIWFECTIIDVVWIEFRQTWKRFDHYKFLEFEIMIQLITLLIVNSFFIVEQRTLRRKLNILFFMTMWILWKTHLIHNFNESVKLWNVNETIDFYRNMIKKHISTNRILCLYEKYRNKKYNSKIFENLWNESFKKYKIKLRFKCLKQKFDFIENYSKKIIANECSNND